MATTIDVRPKNGRGTIEPSHEHIMLQEKTATPSDVEQYIIADSGFYLSKVTVAAIPNTYGHITYSGGVITVW